MRRNGRVRVEACQLVVALGVGLCGQERDLLLVLKLWLAGCVRVQMLRVRVRPQAQRAAASGRSSALAGVVGERVRLALVLSVRLHELGVAARRARAAQMVVGENAGSAG